jgi:hypothetical protein
MAKLFVIVNVIFSSFLCSGRGILSRLSTLGCGAGCWYLYGNYIFIMIFSSVIMHQPDRLCSSISLPIFDKHTPIYDLYYLYSPADWWL